MTWEEARRVLPLETMGGEAVVVARLMDARAQLWLAEDAVGVTEITDDGRLRVWGAGGDMGGLFALLPGVEAWAKAMGCPVVEVLGRKGWQRALARFGFCREGDIMIKEIR